MRGVEVNGAAFRALKSGPKVEFERVACWWTPAQMHQWLWTVNDIWSDLEYELERLSGCSDSDPILAAFPIDPTSCTKYRGCPYHDFCLAWANPLQRCDEPPMGYEVQFWNPHDRPKTHILDVKGSETNGYQAEFKKPEKGGDEVEI